MAQWVITLFKSFYIDDGDGGGDDDDGDDDDVMTV